MSYTIQQRKTDGYTGWLWEPVIVELPAYYLIWVGAKSAMKYSLNATGPKMQNNDAILKKIEIRIVLHVHRLGYQVL